MISADDIFQDPEPVVVDFDLLEAAKENVQRLATGRRVTALSALLATPHAQRDAKLSSARNRLRINVELALEDQDEGDPLEAYCRLVYWTLENYPQGHSAESGLLELLEEATRVLKEHNGSIYHEDLRYLKLWLLYASYVERPTIIYRFLLANDIGVTFALLYEEHAAVLERDGRKQEADEIYSLGIARKADPLERLESRYQDFQKRMMSTIPAPTPSEQQPIPQSSQPKRQILARTSGSKIASSRTAGSRTTTTAPLDSSASRSGFQIFVDPSGLAAELAESEKTWHELGPRKSRVKENVPETKKLVGTTIKQAGRSKRVASASGSGSSGGSSSKIVPFRDPEDKVAQAVPTTSKSSGKAFVPFVDEKEVPAAPAPTDIPRPSTPKFTPFRDEGDAESSRATMMSITDTVIKVKKSSIKAPEPTSEAEALRKDPLKNYSSNGLD